MKFNVDAFKRFNKYINTDAKVRLTQVSMGFAMLSRSYLWSPGPHFFSGAGFKLEATG